MALLLLVLLFWRASQVPKFGAFEIRTITAGTMSLAFLAMAQSIIVISGGIDLSVGSMMVFTNCLAARWMEGQSLGTCVALALVVIAIAMALSTLIGVVITVSGIPDIVVTLAASFILSGMALFVLSSPGGGFSADLQRRVVGGFSEPWPSILWIVGALLLIWLPLKRSRTGIAMFAVGSDRNAAFLSGVQGGQGAGPRLHGRRADGRHGRHRDHGLHRQRRAPRLHRGQRHPEQRGGGRARRSGALGRRRRDWWARCWPPCASR